MNFSPRALRLFSINRRCACAHSAMNRGAGMRRTATRRRKGAFTLVELLVIIVIIGTLAALLMPAMQRSIDVAGQVKCANNLRQLSSAVMLYVNNWDGLFWEFNYFCRPISEEYTGVKSGKKMDTLFVAGNAPDTLYFCGANCNPEAVIPSNYSYNLYLLSYNPNNVSILNRYFKRINAVCNPSKTSLLSECNTYHPTKVPFYYKWDTSINTGLPETEYLRSPHGQRMKSNVVFVDGHAECLSGTLSNKQMGRADTPYDKW